MVDPADVHGFDPFRDLRAFAPIIVRAFGTPMVAWLLIEQDPDLLGPSELVQTPFDLTPIELLPGSPSDPICSVQVQEILMTIHRIRLSVELEPLPVPKMDQMIDSFPRIKDEEEKIRVISSHQGPPVN